MPNLSKRHTSSPIHEAFPWFQKLRRRSPSFVVLDFPTRRSPPAYLSRLPKTGSTQPIRQSVPGVTWVFLITDRFSSRWAYHTLSAIFFFLPLSVKQLRFTPSRRPKVDCFTLLPFPRMRFNRAPTPPVPTNLEYGKVLEPTYRCHVA